MVEIDRNRMDDTADALYVGAAFTSFDSLKAAIDLYSLKYNVKFYKMDSRTLSSGSKVCGLSGRVKNSPAELKFCSIYYACTFGGRRFNSRAAGLNPTRKVSRKQDCPFSMTVKLSKDGQHLIIAKLSANGEHNHDLLTADDNKESDSHAKKSVYEDCMQLCINQMNNEITKKPLKAKRLSIIQDQMQNGISQLTVCTTPEKIESNQDDNKQFDLFRGEGTQDSDICVNDKFSYTSDKSSALQACDSKDDQNLAKTSDEQNARESKLVHISNVFDAMLSFQRRNLFCDTVMQTRDGSSVYAHGVILAAVCPNLFPSLNHAPLTNQQPNVIDFLEYDSSVIRELTEFVYTGCLDVSNNIAEIEELLEILGVSCKVVTQPVQIDVGTDDAVCLDEIYEADENDLRQIVELNGEQTFGDKLSITLTVEDDAVDVLTANTESNMSQLMMNMPVSVPDTNQLKQTVRKCAKKENGDSTKRRTDKDSAQDIHGCQFCTRTFPTAFQLNRHKWDHYITPDGTFECKICKKSFDLKERLRNHVLQRHLDPKSKTYIECPICGHAYNNRMRFESHMNVHSGARPHMCDICGLRVNDIEFLRKHRRIHVGDRRHACSICTKRFYNSNQLKMHMRHHTGEKPYQCADCGMRFTQLNSLKEHMLLHTGERPFTCGICGKTFRRIYHLRLHTGSVHVSNDLKPFMCEHCGRGFPSASYLKQHLQAHLPTKRKRKNCTVAKVIKEQEQVNILLIEKT